MRKSFSQIVVVIFTLLLFVGIMLYSIPIFAIDVGEGAPDDIKGLFKFVYQVDIEKSVLLGSPTDIVQEGFQSSSGTTGYYQRFENGGIIYSNKYGIGLVFSPMYDKWESLGLNADNPLGYPIGNISDIVESSHGTNGLILLFEGGVLVVHISGEREGQVFEIHGAIYDKWKSWQTWGDNISEKSALGFPIGDEEDTPGGRMSQFEGGYIYWRGGSGEAFETHGLIGYIYQEQEGGTGGWLGFPLGDERKWYNGWSISGFDYGYITSLDGINYYAFTYAHDNKPVVYDFWKKADPIYADPGSSHWYPYYRWKPNFDAQFKVKNTGEHGAILIERLALTIIDSTGTQLIQDMTGFNNGRRFDEDIILNVGESHWFTISGASFPWPGEFKVVARAQMQGVWYELGRMDFSVLENVCDTNAPFYGYWPQGGYEAEPVSTATGHYIHQKKDLSLSGKGIPVVFARTYNSLDQRKSSLGNGWTHTYDVSLFVDTEQYVNIRWGDGRVERFRMNGRCQFESINGGNNTLVTNQDGTFSLITPEQITYHFNPVDQLESIADRYGNTVTLHYTDTSLTSITDAAGRQMNLTYDAQGHLTQITDPLGRTVSYAYDANENLIAVTDPEGNITTYTYDDKHQILAIHDPRGNTLVENIYDNQGRVISQRNAKGDITTFSYDDANHTTTITDPLGKTKMHVYNELRQLVAERDANGNTTAYTYDQAWNRTSVTDKNGNTTSYAYDERGNVTAVTDALGKTTTFTYDANNNLLTQTDALGQITSFEYDVLGNLIRSTDPLGNVTTMTYNSSGQLLTITDPNRNVKTMTYDAAGNLTRVTGALGGQTNYTYDNAGRMLTVTDALGRVTTFAYNDNDQQVSITNPLGNSSQYTYDANGNTLTLTDFKGQITRFTHDVKDLLTAKTNPLGGVQTFAYDALDRLSVLTDPKKNQTTFVYDNVGNLLQKTDAAGNTTSFTYDANGNALTMMNALNETTRFTYDALNRLTATTDPLGNTTVTSYDALGRVMSLTNAKGQMTSFTYDAAGRLLEVMDANSGKVRYTYDANGNRLSMTEPNGNVTLFAYDALNRMIAKAEPLGGQHVYTYDAVGNLTQYRDPNGNVMRYAYDALNRLTTINYPDGAVTQFAYDANGNRIAMNDKLGNSSYQYDALNRMTSSTDSFGMTVRYQYDVNGNRIGLTYPDGKVVQYGYDTLNRLASVTDWLNHTTTYTYNQASRVIRTLNPNGTTTTYTYDRAGRITGLLNAKSDGSIISSYVYTLDALGNHLQANVSEPLLPRFTSQTIAYTYDAQNRLTQAGATMLTFDANGNLIQQGTDAFTYNTENRLIQSVIGSVTTQYHYDGAGNRLAKIVGGNTTRYTLDINGDLSNVLAETDNTGKITAYYVYGPGLLSRILPDGTAAYYHYDYRGSTIALTDQAEKVTDEYAYDPFGKITNSPGNILNPFKYVGKYGVIDEGNSLIYMRARYYSEELGRFLNKDVMNGNDRDSQSLNQYTYVNNNPLILIDPQGLFLLYLVGIDAFCQSKPEICSAIISTTWDIAETLYRDELPECETPDPDESTPALIGNIVTATAKCWIRNDRINSAITINLKPCEGGICSEDKYKYDKYNTQQIGQIELLTKKQAETFGMVIRTGTSMKYFSPSQARDYFKTFQKGPVSRNLTEYAPLEGK